MRFAQTSLLSLVLLLIASCTNSAPISLSLSPTSLSLAAGDPAQVIRANLQNSSSSNITWTLSPNLGSLNTTTGLEVRYLPPKDLAEDATVTLTASAGGASAKLSIDLRPQLKPSLGINPATIGLTAGDEGFVFTVSVQNSQARVLWSLSNEVGSLSEISETTVKYTPPVHALTQTTVQLRAQLQGTDQIATATITVRPQPTAALTISPRGNPTLVLDAGSLTQTFRATIQNAANDVTWSLSPDLPTSGSLQPTTGIEVQYTPPASLTSPVQVTLTARLTGGTVSDSISLTIKPQPATLSISPSSIGITAGSSGQTFDAAVQNSAVTIQWSLSPNLGNLSTSTGEAVVYTPPADVTTITTVTLTARLADGSVQATSTISLRPKPQPALYLSPNSISVEFGASPFQIFADLQNATGNISWTVSPNYGSLSSTTGNSVFYTPPSNISTVTQVTITARLSGTSLQSTATINLLTPSNSTTTCQGVDQTSNLNIIGYTNKISYAPGELLNLYVSTPNNHDFSLAIYRDGNTSPLVWFSRGHKATLQSLTNYQPYAVPLNWALSTQVPIPNDWISGLYRLRLIDQTTRQCFQTMVVVRRAAGLTKPAIAVLANTFTWQAYNRWGGASYYNCAAGTCDGRATAPIVTFERPQNQIFSQNLGTGVHQIVQWLESNGYAYDLIADQDLDSNPNTLSGYRILVLPRHSEYWSGKMLDSVELFLARGNYLVSLGGNQMYWKVVTQGSQMEVKKYLDDTQHTFVNEVGGLWRTVGRPEARILGNRFTSAGMGQSNLAPYKALNPNHWVLSGTGLIQDQTFGEQCSGWETDKIDPANSPSNLEHIAQGTNIDTTTPTQPAGADMVYYRPTGGGGVFAVGSLAFFSDSCRNDPIITRIVRNVLDRFLR